MKDQLNKMSIFRQRFVVVLTIAILMMSAISCDAKPAAYRDFPFVQQGSARIYYDPKIDSYVSNVGKVIPASDGKGLYMVAHPEFAEFNFSLIKARIYVTPVAEYEKTADFAPEIIADLQRLIEGSESFENCVPELPLNQFFHDCGHQQFISNNARIRLGNGQAIRFVTVYGIQDLRPVGNDTLVYVLQGFTDDGEYYVKAVVKLMHSQLPGIGEIPPEVYTAQNADEADAYFRDYAQMFDQSEGESKPLLEWIEQVMGTLYSRSDFSPRLEWIDQVMGSLYIEGVE
jgi:hypothetical protein